MDRTRDAGAEGPGVGTARDPGGALTLRRRPGVRLAAVAAVLGAALACGKLGTDLDQIVALEVRFPDSAVVEEGDTIFPWVRALNGRGDSVAATASWASLDTLFLQVLDSTTGATFGKKPGNGRLQTRVGALRSNPVSLKVNPQADTIFLPTGGQVGRDTVTVSTSADSLSDSLQVRIQDLTSGAAPVNLANRPVTYQITYPSGGSDFTLVPQGSVLTGTGGIAAVRVRLVNRTLPDSVVVTATAVRANGQPVPGSPVTFVVEFLP